MRRKIGMFWVHFLVHVLSGCLENCRPAGHVTAYVDPMSITKKIMI